MFCDEPGETRLETPLPRLLLKQLRKAAMSPPAPADTNSAQRLQLLQTQLRLPSCLHLPCTLNLTGEG